jgi:hypothetical protein
MSSALLVRVSVLRLGRRGPNVRRVLGSEARGYFSIGRFRARLRPLDWSVSLLVSAAQGQAGLAVPVRPVECRAYPRAAAAILAARDEAFFKLDSGPFSDQ